MKQIGTEMIAAYSPQARGRSERTFGTHQGRLPRELALHGITTMDDANRDLAEVYRPAHNTEFMQLAAEEGSSFMPWGGSNLDDILCEQYGRTVTADNPDLIGTLKAKRCKFQRTGIDVITSGSGCVSIGTQTAHWPFFTARESWLIMMHREN